LRSTSVPVNLAAIDDGAGNRLVVGGDDPPLDGQPPLQCEVNPMAAGIVVRSTSA
jgi:hypothetical protein